MYNDPVEPGCRLLRQNHRIHIRVDVGGHSPQMVALFRPANGGVVGGATATAVHIKRLADSIAQPLQSLDQVHAYVVEAATASTGKLFPGEVFG